MAEYRLHPILPRTVIRTADELIIDKDARPIEWAAFVTWIRAGNLPDPPEGMDAESGAAAIARMQLSANDFQQVRTAIQNAATLAALRPILLAMLTLIWRVAKANGLNTDPE